MKITVYKGVIEITIFKAVLLGILVGITEFLPISSSAHLMIIQRLFQAEEEITFLLYTTFRIGAFIAVLGVLWGDVLNILKRPFSKLSMFVVMASLPNIILTVLLDDYISNILITSFTLAFGLIIIGIVLLLAETVKLGYKDIETMSIKNALYIGIIQSFSILPIISRTSMAIAGSISQRLDRRFVMRFSFLLAIPTMLASIIFHKNTLLQAIHTPNLTGAIITGTIAATISGCFAINSMQRLLINSRLNRFAYYVILLGIFILLDKFYFHLLFH